MNIPIHCRRIAPKHVSPNIAAKREDGAEVDLQHLKVSGAQSLSLHKESHTSFQSSSGNSCAGWRRCIPAQFTKISYEHSNRKHKHYNNNISCRVDHTIS